MECDGMQGRGAELEKCSTRNPGMVDKSLQIKSCRNTILFDPIFPHKLRMDEGATRRLSTRFHKFAPAFILLCIWCVSSSTLQAQDWVKTGTGLGVDKVRPAVPDSKQSTRHPQNVALLKTFNDTLWNDLHVSGVVELVSKSFYPLQAPAQPPEVNFIAWNSP